MARRIVRARDVEALENTTFASLALDPAVEGLRVDYTQTCPTPWGTWTCGCELCVANTDCCGVEVDPKAIVSPWVPGGVGWREW